MTLTLPSREQTRAEAAPLLRVRDLSVAYGRTPVVHDVSFTTIFKGVIPFVLTDLLRLVILIAFPVIALWLPGQMG